MGSFLCALFFVLGGGIPLTLFVLMGCGAPESESTDRSQYRIHWMGPFMPGGSWELWHGTTYLGTYLSHREAKQARDEGWHEPAPSWQSHKEYQ
ncbi:membrane protein [Gordonia phage Denise]|uniref:Membrane protein n=1 Tax=Gordonia phage Denise TaxID=2652879 RepID=A0A5P8DCF8_9CAUD|nr:membrane protein [Gordonia phage Denise]QFP96683.1 membrane protein [Gordonia phage Denise]